MANCSVLNPYWNGDDVTGRPRDYWLISLPTGMSEADASLFVEPFAHISTTPDKNGKLIKELRADLGDRGSTPWWEQDWPRPIMRARSEERRGGGAWVRTGRTRGEPCP